MEYKDQLTSKEKGGELNSQSIHNIPLIYYKHKSADLPVLVLLQHAFKLPLLCYIFPLPEKWKQPPTVMQSNDIPGSHKEGLATYSTCCIHPKAAHNITSRHDTTLSIINKSVSTMSQWVSPFKAHTQDSHLQVLKETIYPGFFFWELRGGGFTVLEAICGKV